MIIKLELERDGVCFMADITVEDDYGVARVRGAVMSGTDNEVELTKQDEKDAIKEFYIETTPTHSADDYFDDR